LVWIFGSTTGIDGLAGGAIWADVAGGAFALGDALGRGFDEVTVEDCGAAL
jgi:hypothetical protein